MKDSKIITKSTIRRNLQKMIIIAKLTILQILVLKENQT